MAAITKARGKARLEARIDAELDDLISEAADRLDVTKTAFISEALREAALKVIARSDITMMDPKSLRLDDGLDRYRRRVIRIAHVGCTAAAHHTVSNPSYHVVSFAADFDLGSFDCGEAGYNDWLTRHASASVKAGVCAVYLLIERSQDRERVVGYFAINPAQVVREQAPLSLSRAWPLSVLARPKHRQGQRRPARDARRHQRVARSRARNHSYEGCSTRWPRFMASPQCRADPYTLASIRATNGRSPRTRLTGFAGCTPHAG